MTVLLLVLEIFGTVAFAVSGSLTAFKKDMDLLGVLILGLTTALGGGMIRDVMLGITPPHALTNPLYATIAFVTSLLLFLPHSVEFFEKIHFPAEKVLLVMDSLGLGVFTVLGVQTAGQASGNALGVFPLVFFGVLTGVGGGILRDIMAGNPPYVFVKHFYASASILGALTCVVIMKYSAKEYEYIALLAGIAVVVVLRLCASHYKWKLPKHVQ